MKHEKLALLMLVAVAFIPASAPAKVGVPLSEPWIYSSFGPALNQLGVSRLLSDGTGDELLLIAHHSSYYRQNFVVSRLTSGTRSKVHSVWAAGYDQYWRDPDPTQAQTKVTRAAQTRRHLSKAEAGRLMDTITQASQLPMAGNVCLHGPTYNFIMRRSGTVTHGNLEYCGHPQTNSLMCEVVKGAACERGHPVQMRASWVPPPPHS